MSVLNIPGAWWSDPAGGERELLLHNGRLQTQEPSLPLATVLAARGGEIVYVGHDLSAAAARLSPSARRLDLKGRTVIPGLTDGHSHLISEGLRLGEVDLHGLSREETLAAVAREAAGRPAGEWIIGLGWDQRAWAGGQWPDRSELDRAAPDHPVVLDRLDKHSAWVNSLALKLAGVDSREPDPPGGELLRRPSGELSGLLVGRAMFLVKKAVPPPDEPTVRQALKRAQEEMFGFGLTSLVVAGALVEDLERMARAYQDGELKIRVRAMLLAYDRQDEVYLDGGGRLVEGLFGERLSIAGIKIHSDGSLGSRSAWLREDYRDRPGRRGAGNYDDEGLAEILARARDHQLQVSIHVIGDAAVDQALRAMDQVLRGEPGDRRWRLEHLQVAEEEDLERAARLGLTASLQTVGLMADLGLAEERLNPRVLERSYAWRSFLERGLTVVNGSDGPVDSVNPFEGMYAAVTRRNLQGRPAGGWRPEHRLTRREALATYTTASAWSEFAENRKGSLRPGKLADLAVLDRDYFACPEEEIKDIRVLATVLGGEIVHQERDF